MKGIDIQDAGVASACSRRYAWFHQHCILLLPGEQHGQLSTSGVPSFKHFNNAALLLM